MALRITRRSTATVHHSDDDDDDELARRPPSTRLSPRKSSADATSAPGKENRAPSHATLAIDTASQNHDGPLAALDSTRVLTRTAAASLPTPRATPTKNSFPSPTRSIAHIFAHAHALLSTSSTLHSTLPLVGRTQQRVILQRFLKARFGDLYEDVLHNSVGDPCPSIYISGPPGLGKTALLAEILSDFSTRIVSSGPPSTPTKFKEKWAHTGCDVRVHLENCASIGTVGMETSLWDRLARGLGIQESVIASGKKGLEGFRAGLDANAGMRWYVSSFSSRSTSLTRSNSLIVLDEIDHILSTSASTKTSKQNLLNQLFSLVHSGRYPITLVGIANALDLTIRALHLDNLSLSVKGKEKEYQGPVLLHFEPYKPEDISSIVRQRLAHLDTIPAYPHLDTLSPARSEPSTSILSAETTSLPAFKAPLPLFAPQALEFLAKKVSAVTGDIRTALAIAQHSINLLETIELGKSSSSTSSFSSGPGSSKLDLARYTSLDAPKVQIAQVLKALKHFNLSTKTVSLESKIGELNFNSRIVLVGIIVALFRTRHELLSTGKSSKGGQEWVRLVHIFEVYKDILKKEGTLHPLSKEEFRTAVENSLESGGFVVSSKGDLGIKSNKRIVGGDSTNPLISLPDELDLLQVARALRLVPATSPHLFVGPGETKSISGVLEETLRISISLLDREERRIEGSKRLRAAVDADAPSEGFHGNGLGSGRWIGEKRRRIDDSQ